MPVASVVLFASPNIGIACLALAIADIAIARWRRIDPSGVSAWLMCVGTILLAVAAAGPVWIHPKPGNIAIMVDLSPSTRGANFRKPEFVRERVAELIDNARYELIGFSADNRQLDPAGPFDEIPADQTVFSPINADAIILFSDTRFELPAKSPPIYPAVDSGLENVADASVRKVESFGRTLTATIANNGPPRQATFPGSTAPVGNGTFIIARPIPAADQIAKVELNPGDLWPENDSLTVRISPPWLSEKWWIGENPPAGWRVFSSAALPDLPEQYLAPAIIVIDNQSADQFSPAVLDRLMQYVRDLGGSMLIVGGDHAFAAGGYSGTILEQMSPLASYPPDATTRWLLLADASGSMSQDAGDGRSRWQAATQAIIHLLPALPPADVVQIGQFSDSVRWWLPAQSAASAAKMPLPPVNAFPHGPTNLESALNQIAEQTDSALPTQLLLVSDCDAEIGDPAGLQDRLLRKKIHLHVLAIDRGSALEIIRKISAGTGGGVIEQFDAGRWINSIENLSRAALPPLLLREAVEVVFENTANSLSNVTASVWNRTWLKPDATPYARAGKIPMAGYWHVGSGSVAATAFEPDLREIESFANLIAQKPRDPRFSVRWETASRLHVTVDAVDSGKFLNDLPITLELADDAGKKAEPLQQTGPGRYEAVMTSSRNSRIATLRSDDEIIDRISVSGRYPPEFDAVGNDHAAMAALADRSGGQIIWPSDHRRIDFHWPTVATPLGPWICAVGLLLISAGLIYSNNGNWRES
jgi:VWA domain-containing protein